MIATATRARKPRFIAGGDDEDDSPVDVAPTRTRYSCVATGCPKAGAIFPSSSSRGICCYHYAQNPTAWPRITQVITGWSCVTYEIGEAARVLCDQDSCTDAKAQDEAMRNGWERLQPVLVASGWAATELEPKHGEHLGHWANRLEAFVATQVADALNRKQP